MNAAALHAHPLILAQQSGAGQLSGFEKQLMILFLLLVGAGCVILLYLFGRLWDEMFGRRRSGPPHQRRPHRQGTDVAGRQRRVGEEGELLVSETLSELPEHGHCYVFNDVPERRAGNIDHLVVGPGGVTIVETKANGGTLSWDGDPDTEMLINGAPIKRDPMKQMEAQVDAFDRRFSCRPKSEGRRARPLTELLGAGGKHWMWCFTRARLPGGPYTPDPHLCSPKSVVGKLVSQEPHFEPPEVDYVAGRIARAYDIEPDAAPVQTRARSSANGGNSVGRDEGRREHGRGREGGRLRGPGR